MSLSLDLGTKPDGTIAMTDLNGTVVEVGPVTMTTEDFCQLVIYVLTNTDLVSGDSRLHLMNQIAKLNVVQGYNGIHSTRLG